jgi:hypothetical protein
VGENDSGLGQDLGQASKLPVSHAIVCLLTPRAGPKLRGRVAHTDATMFDRMAKSALRLSFVAILLAIAALFFRHSLLVLSPTG